MSGLFVDGAFVRSWMTKAETSQGARAYLAGLGKPAPLPLDYLGRLPDLPAPAGHLSELWLGPCGASIIHIRPEMDEPDWSTYAGGKPHRNKLLAGRAYLCLTSDEPFWLTVCLASFRRHFARAKRYVVNAEIPADWPFEEVDRNDPIQCEDMKTVDAYIAASKSGDYIRVEMAISTDLGARLMAKLALALGHKLLGDAFLDSEHAKLLRTLFREGNARKRQDLSLNGSSFLQNAGGVAAGKILRWEGGWFMLVSLVDGMLVLIVVSPSGVMMNVPISDDPSMLEHLDPVQREGMVWVTVPAAEAAVGPVPLPTYLAHGLGVQEHSSLAALAHMRGDPAELPACR